MVRVQALKEGSSGSFIGFDDSIESINNSREELAAELVDRHSAAQFAVGATLRAQISLETYSDQIHLNWLAQQMTRLGLRHQQQDNCFTWIEDVEKARRLLDQQLNTRWAVELEGLVLENHPTYEAICRPIALSYYWTACESEYATDVMFARQQRLAQLYPRLVHHGIKSFGRRDVLRFLAYICSKACIEKIATTLLGSSKDLTRSGMALLATDPNCPKAHAALTLSFEASEFKTC